MRPLSLTVHCALVAAVLTGCAGLPDAKDASLTYETLPGGAELFEGAQKLGQAPVTRIYKHDGKSDNIRTPEITAVWPSGAKESFYTFLPKGADRVTTIERPKTAPGLQVDLDNAKQLALAKERDTRRAKEAVASDVARASARCKDQQAGRSLSILNDC